MNVSESNTTPWKVMGVTADTLNNPLLLLHALINGIALTYSSPPSSQFHNTGTHGSNPTVTLICSTNYVGKKLVLQM